MLFRLFRNATVSTAAVVFKTISKANEEYKKAKPKIDKVKNDIAPVIEETKKTINPIIESTVDFTLDFTKNVIDDVMNTEIIKSIRNELKAISKRRAEQYERERRKRIEELRAEIDSEISKDFELVFLDVEADKTGRRVREVSAIKVLMNFKNKTLKEIDRFEKFYDDTREIKEYEDGKEIEIEYGDYEFKIEHDGDNLSENDKEEFYNFAKNAEMMVSHNVQYDMKFFDKLDDKKRFCTMESNVNMTKLEFEYCGKSFYKFPKLKETAEFYNIPFNQNMLHTSMYDTNLCMRVFEKMMINEKAQKNILYDLFGLDFNKKINELSKEEYCIRENIEL